MECQILFSRKNKKNIPKCHLLKFYPSCKVLIHSKVLVVYLHCPLGSFCVYTCISHSLIREKERQRRSIEKCVEKHFFFTSEQPKSELACTSVQSS